MHREMEIFDQVFHAEIINKFREFIKQYNDISLDRWLVFSDYCLEDPKKSHSAAVFTIVPLMDPPDALIQTMSSIAPKDLKKTKEIDEKFGEYIKSGQVFNFSFVFEKKNKHYFLKRTKDEYQSEIDTLMGIVQKWIEDKPEEATYCKEILKKLKVLRQEMGRSTFNLNLYQKIAIVNAIVSYLFYIISKESETRPSLLGWFSDRDSILTSYDAVIKDVININYRNLCEYKGIKEKACTELTFPDNSSFKEKTLWYDELNRIPDFLAGAFAGINNPVEENDKYHTLFKEAIADNPYLGVMYFSFENEQRKIDALDLTLKK
ncbi:hypothetical protein CON22_24910 [Bacillus cereus]|nr:hypothetical protein CON22_24910 [Bacillus cereus]